MVDLGPIHNSHLTAVRRCKRKFWYAFIEGIQPKQPGLPLARGIWLHYCLEAQYLKWGLEDGTLLRVPEYTNIDGVGKVRLITSEDKPPVLVIDDPTFGPEALYPLSARGMLSLLTDHVWSRLLQGEREKYTEDGHTLPEACERILTEYFYYWREDYFKNREFDVLLVEVEWKRNDGKNDREGRIDYVIRNKRGQIVVGDWKSTKSEPHAEYKFMESQLHLYPWGVQPLLKELGLTDKELNNIIVEFDYLSTKLPTTPSLNQDGSMSKRKINTTYLTVFNFLKENGLKWSKEEVEEYLEKTEKVFFVKKTLPRSKKVTDNLLKEDKEDIELIDRIAENPEAATRTVSLHCNWDCDFLELCKGELYEQDMRYIRKTKYETRSNSHAGVVTNED